MLYTAVMERWPHRIKSLCSLFRWLWLDACDVDNRTNLWQILLVFLFFWMPHKSWDKYCHCHVLVQVLSTCTGRAWCICFAYSPPSALLRGKLEECRVFSSYLSIVLRIIQSQHDISPYLKTSLACLYCAEYACTILCSIYYLHILLRYCSPCVTLVWLSHSWAAAGKNEKRLEVGQLHSCMLLCSLLLCCCCCGLLPPPQARLLAKHREKTVMASTSTISILLIREFWEVEVWLGGISRAIGASDHKPGVGLSYS